MPKKFTQHKYFLTPTKEQKDLLKKTLEISLNFFDGQLRNDKFLNYKDPMFFKGLLDAAMPQKSREVKEALKIMKEIGRYSISQADLNYMSFPDSGNSIVAMMGSLFTKFLNQNMICFDRSAPIATFIEIQLIEWLRELIGYDHKPLRKIDYLADVSGMWTSGGHMSNHIGILAAMNNAFPEIKEKGLSGLKVAPVILLARKNAHYSFEAAVHHLGIGKDNILDVPVNKDYTTNYAAIENLLKGLPANKKPFILISVAGNSRTSGIDDIVTANAICKKYGLWHHVDACHGGSLLFSKKLKSKYLPGIEQADSVTIDPHKGLFVLYPSSFVMFKNRSTLTMFSRYKEQCYTNTTWDLGLITPFFGSRGFESLSLWLMIKIMGLRGLKEAVEYRAAMAKFAESLILKNKDFIPFNKMDLYRMAFAYCPVYIKEYINSNKKLFTPEISASVKKLISKYDHIINQSLYEAGELCLDEYKLLDVDNGIGLGLDDPYLIMAMALGNPLYTEKSIKKSLGILFKKANKHKAEMIEEFLRITKSEGNIVDYSKRQSGPASW